MKHLKSFILLIASLLVVAGCGSSPAVQTTNPEPIEEQTLVVQQEASGAMIMLSVDDKGDAYVLKFDEDGKQVEKVKVEIILDSEGNFTITVTFSDGSTVTIEGTVGPNGMIVDAELSLSAIENGNDNKKKEGEDEAKTEYVATKYDKKLNFDQIEVGRGFGCVILNNGSLRCWGNNKEGQLGNWKYGETKELVAVDLLEKIQSVATGINYAYAVSIDNEFYAWGKGEIHPQPVGDIKNADRVFTSKQSDTINNQTCVITIDNELICWMESPEGIDVKSIHIMSDVRDITVKDEVGFLLRIDGSIYRWINDGSKAKVKKIYKGSSNKDADFHVEIEVIDDGIYLLNSDGALVVYDEDSGTFKTWYDSSCLESIAFSGGTALAFDTNGALFSEVVDNPNKWINDDTFISYVTAIASGFHSACVVEGFKTLKCWSTLDPEMVPHIIDFHLTY